VVVEFYRTTSGRSPIEEFVEELSKKDQARFADVIVGIETHGFECPRVTFRQLKGKLWEIKFKSSGGQYRVAYVTVERNVMVWLHVFKKKTPKTPLRDRELAEKRMREVLRP